MSDTSEYRIWTNIKSRCRDPKNISYKDYGGRGITMCEEWYASFAAFYAAVGPRPSEQYSLDREENEKGYEPGNVRWVTADVQVNNRRCTRRILYNGQNLTIKEWAAITGLKACTILNRFRYGRTPEDILTKPLHSNKGIPKVTEHEVRLIRRLYDEGREASDLAKQLGLSRGCIHSVIRGHAPRGIVCPPCKRTLRPHHPKGESSRSSKLSEGDVKEIRRLYDEGKLRLKDIGKSFGVSAVLIGLIGKRKTWKHLPDIRPTDLPSPEPEEPQMAFPWV